MANPVHFRDLTVQGQMPAAKMTLRRTFLQAIVAGAVITASLQGQGASEAAGAAIDVIHYDARVEPDIRTRTIHGAVTIRFAVRRGAQDAIEFDSGDLLVDAVREGGVPRRFVQLGPRLRIQMARTVPVNEIREVEIEYHGTPPSGIRFFPDRLQVYTVFSTSQWLVCVDAPEDKATLRLTVVLPAGLTAVGSGRLTAREAAPDGRIRFEWRQDQPAPTYTFGFAAGNFTEMTESRGRVRARYLAEGFSTAELARIFHDTTDMLDFFASRAGVPYPGAVYTQVLTVQGAGQELSGFAVLPEAYGRAVLKEESATGLGAHELAHQWWGNQVTCRDWTHFWLNEGFATFMAAAYTEHRDGRQAYLRIIDGVRARYQQVKDAGHDRPLVFSSWNRPTADDRSIVYQKGAYVLHLLRENLGDRPFWTGLRDYTRRYAGKSVLTADFQTAMEKSSGRNLSEFFATWVY
jgi:aminopeptidase N